MSTLPQPDIRTFFDRDKNGIIWCYPKQEFKNSCGAASLRYVKQLVHNQLLPEKKARKQISQFELLNPIGSSAKTEALDKAKAKVAPELHNKVEPVRKALEIVLTPEDRKAARKQRGLGLVPKAWEGDPSWEATGTRPELVVQALHAEPLAVPTARLIVDDYYDHLMKTTPACPAILAVMWMIRHDGPATDVQMEKALASRDSLGGHFVVCTGPTRDGSQFVILDPQNGVRYLDRKNVTRTCILYDSGRINGGWTGGSIGKVDSTMQKNPEPTNVDGQLVSYVAKSSLSLCGVIVTYPSA